MAQESINHTLIPTTNNSQDTFSPYHRKQVQGSPLWHSQITTRRDTQYIHQPTFPQGTGQVMHTASIEKGQITSWKERLLSSPEQFLHLPVVRNVRDLLGRGCPCVMSTLRKLRQEDSGKVKTSLGTQWVQEHPELVRPCVNVEAKVNQPIPDTRKGWNWS